MGKLITRIDGERVEIAAERYRCKLLACDNPYTVSLEPYDIRTFCGCGNLNHDIARNITILMSYMIEDKYGIATGFAPVDNTIRDLESLIAEGK